VAVKIPILQIVHGTDSPFLELAGRYAGVFDRERFEVTTVFLTGADDARVQKLANSDRVLCLGLSSRDLAGMKRAAIKPVRELCLQTDYALIIAQRYKALYVAWQVAKHMSKPRVLGVAHAFGVMDSWGRRLLFRMHRQYTWLAGVSQSVADDMKADCGAGLADRIVSLPNCVDTAALDKGLFPKAVARNVLDLPEQAFVFGNVGRLHPDKDPLSLVDAFARAATDMPDACLVLIGEGRLRDPLQARIAALGLQSRVRLLGKVANAWRLFAAFDAYVSTSDREPFGIVLNEAQAARVPVIAADCGGAGEVVADSGLLYSRAQPEQLDARLLQLYRMSADARRALGERGHARLQQEYSLAAFAERFKRLEAVQALWEHDA
jgi:hypothetical protein